MSSASTPLITKSTHTKPASIHHQTHEMYSISSRPRTPNQSPHHSRPVPIPQHSSPDLPTANALRYKHLYGYTQPSTTPSTDQTSVTDSSEGDYEDYVVDTREVGIVIDERDGVSISSESTASSSTGTVSTSPRVFPLSRVPTIAAAGSSPDRETLIEDVEKALALDDGTQTPVGTSRFPHIPHLQAMPSLGNAFFPAGLSDNSSTSSFTRHRSFSASPRAARKALDRLDDEFRCQTCYHAGLCADLVMDNPNFRCGDINPVASSPRGLSTSASVSMRGAIRGKTPWTRQMLSGINLGSDDGADDDAGKPKLRVLDGGVDYVHYDESAGSSSPGLHRALIDVEDIAQGIRGGSKDRQPTPQPVSATAATTLASGSTGTSSSDNMRRPLRQTWTDIKVEDPVLTTTSANPSSNSSSFSNSIRPTCARTRVHLEPALQGPETTSTTDRPPLIEQTRRPRLDVGGGRGRSRSHYDPIRTLHNLTSGLLSGRSWDSERVDERYDYDDKLYGVDIVERGRSRSRVR